MGLLNTTTTTDVVYFRDAILITAYEIGTQVSLDWASVPTYLPY